MTKWYCRIGVLVCVVVAFAVTGCHKRTHREVKVHEETHLGEVHEADRGEMVPE
jgi:hypothetical protein